MADRGASHWVVGVDVGGTFTDFYAFDRSSGEVRLHKTPSTPDNPANAIIEGVRELGRSHGVPLDAVAALAHGTTVATNALIQRKGGTVAVITTRGFRDLLEIGRQVRPRMYDMRADYPQPLAKRQHRFEITERIGPDGGVLEPLALAELTAIVTQLRRIGAQACAVCLLFAYLNPDHERRIGEYLRKHLPEMAVSLSSEVQPEFREYERFSTTLLNAYLQPVLDQYMVRLREQLAKTVPHARVGINQSSGGLMSIEQARSFPIRTALSGPAAGVGGAIYMAKLSQRPETITLDMGGTSADVAMVRNYDVQVAFERNVADFPVRQPMVDINTVGAGGGSIAWFDLDGLLKVGPSSAGARPGPACYGYGGRQATVTDANVVLGRLSSRGLLGGTMALDAAAAREVIVPIAERIGIGVEQTALGILDIVTANMVRAIRAISVERGHDPRTFTLLAFGGAGPLLACSVARALGIREVLVPLSPGILCAQGLVVSDNKEHFVRSRRLTLSENGVAEVQGIVDELFREASAWFEREAVSAAARRADTFLDMRYVGQNFELQVPLEGTSGQAPRLDLERVGSEFRRAHEQSYGYSSTEDPMEVVNVRITARGVLPMPPRARATREAAVDPPPHEWRDVWFGAASPHRTPIYDRARIAAGSSIVGPAVIDQFDATTVVHPGDILRVDEALNLMIELTS